MFTWVLTSRSITIRNHQPVQTDGLHATIWLPQNGFPAAACRSACRWILYRMDGNSRQPGQVAAECKDIGQIHRHGVICFFTDLEGRRRGGRPHDEIDFLERVLKISKDERSCFLRFQIVGIVVSGA